MSKKDYDNQTDKKQSIQQENFFLTFDLGCVAALVSAGFSLVTLDKRNIKKVQFSFKKEKGLDQAVNSYFSDKMSVNARTLIDNIKMIKNRIYSS